MMISKEETDRVMKIVKFLKQAGFLIKAVSESIENDAKDQRSGFLGMLLGTLGTSLLESLLAEKEVIPAGEETTTAGEGEIYTSRRQGTIRAGQDF